MNKEKLLYEAPTAQTFVVRFEGAILTGSNLGSSGFSEQGNVIDDDTDGWGW